MKLPIDTIPGRATISIDPAWSVNETLQRVPQTMRVFNAVGIDTCCGGGATLVVAAADAAISLDSLLEMLEAASVSDD